ncbi:MAG: hypothetical protein GX776_06250, partial [Oxalobacter sp.]|nr:hypothetical protein [Oxalobacter sp.]
MFLSENARYLVRIVVLCLAIGMVGSSLASNLMEGRKYYQLGDYVKAHAYLLKAADEGEVKA